ncbi:MAG: hypothetical protein GY841_00270 [FCB group bacterium]|nr:hypothetical protein [FCB group bacterium]
MIRKAVLAVFTLSLLAVLLVSCKSTYFHVTEEARDNVALKFKTDKAYLEGGKSISLTSGGFLLTPGDSTVLFVEGRGRYSEVGEVGVASLGVTETARFYMTLPTMIKPGRYDIHHKSICEILGSLNYNQGETLFTCQSGQVVIDSLYKGKFYGKFKGEYINTSNKRLTVDGDFKVKQK